MVVAKIILYDCDGRYVMLTFVLATENLNNTTCFILNSKTEVAVANCVTSYWGNKFRAQQGKVSKIDCLDRVTVRWVDGSESQFNVHPTDRPDTDTVLCFHCR